MFKTIQNNPGVITIFHNTKSKLSQSLLSKLQQSAKPYHKEPESSKTQSIFSRIIYGNSDDASKTPQLKYNIEEVDSGFPTYDQLKIIKSFVKIHPASKSTFLQAFPKFVDPNVAHKGFSVNISDLQIPDESETIELINTNYDKLIEDGIFKPPLVIDWDNQLLANNEITLERILRHYRAENHSNGD